MIGENIPAWMVKWQVAERMREPLAIALGLFIVVAAGVAWIMGATAELFRPGWLPTSGELSQAIMAAEILFGIGLILPVSRKLAGALLAAVVLVTWIVTLYFVVVPQGEETVSKGEIPSQIAEWKLLTQGQWREGATLPQLETPANQPGVLRIRVPTITADRQPWHVQLNRSGLSVDKDRSYLLSLRARAASSRRIVVGVARASGDFGSLGLYRELSVTEGWQQLGFVFSATDSDAAARIYFDLGQEVGDVELAAINLEERSPTAPLPPAAVWQLSVNAPVAERSALARLEFPIDPPQSLRVKIFKTTRERQAWNLQLNQPNLAVVKDHEYVLRFRARAAAARPISVALGRAYGDYDTLGFYREVALTKNWQPFEFIFSPTVGDGNARIFFDLGQEAHDVELADIVLATSGDIELAAKQVANPPAGATPSGKPNGAVAGGAHQAPVSQRSLWLQVVAKPLWMLILLWCSHWLPIKREAFHDEF